MPDKTLRLYFQGDSFENTMSLHEMHKVLEGLKEILQIIYGEKGCEVYIHEILPGSCDIKALFKEYSIQVGAGVTVAVISAMLFTQGKSFTYQINGNNNSLTIINIENESMTFENGIQLPRILENAKFRTAGQKLTSPIQYSEDSLTIEESDNPEQKVILNKENKDVFKEINNTISSERIRGRIYEINIDAQSFKVDIPTQDRKFTVKLDPNAKQDISDFLPYVGTDHISLIGNAERNMQGEIVKFSVIYFEVEQVNLL